MFGKTKIALSAAMVLSTPFGIGRDQASSRHPCSSGHLQYGPRSAIR